MLEQNFNQGGGTAVLDRPNIFPTETEPVLQPVGSEMAVAGGTEDSSITVIENPALTGLTGLLISRSFFDGAQRRLTGVLHLRVDGNFVVKEQEQYPLVALRNSGGQEDLYSVLADRHILPSISKKAFMICFISPEDYARYNSQLQRVGDRVRPLKSLYEFLAQTRYPEIRLDETGNLLLPPDYAMVERVYGLGLFR